MSMTNKRKLYYMLHSGKNSKMKFFAKALSAAVYPFVDNAKDAQG